MKPETTEYTREIHWSEEDRCYVGRCPELFLGGTHGDDRQSVAEKLDQLIREVVDDLRGEGRPLPQPRQRRPRSGRALPARQAAGLNQKRFAAAIGVGVGTLRNWEQGRSRPGGPASRLLKLVERRPEILGEIAEP